MTVNVQHCLSRGCAGFAADHQAQRSEYAAIVVSTTQVRSDAIGTSNQPVGREVHQRTRVQVPGQENSASTDSDSSQPSVMYNRIAALANDRLSLVTVVGVLGHRKMGSAVADHVFGWLLGSPSLEAYTAAWVRRSIPSFASNLET